MCKKEKPRAGRSVISTCGSVKGLGDGHNLDPSGWGTTKQNGFRETWAGSCCQLGQQGLVTPGSGSLLGGEQQEP